MANPSQLFLLADHLKLSLLERQRAISLNLEPNSQDGHISRSLDSLRDGLEAIERQRRQLESSNDPSAVSLKDQEDRIRGQYEDLSAQFQGKPLSVKTNLTQPNNSELSPDFVAASSTRPRIPSSSSFLKKSVDGIRESPKSVRFSDAPLSPSEEANRAALFPYRDDPDEIPDQGALDNQQIHEYHRQVIQDQDDQLDRLGESIGRQRDLSIQIGDELDSHAQLLDDVETHVDRHQSRLDVARKRLNKVANSAKDNMQLTTILVLIIVLVLLIIILK